MAKIKLIGGRRVAPQKKPTPIQKEKSHKLPAVRVKESLSGLSIKQLVKATPAYIRSNAEDVVVKALRPATTKGGMPGIRTKTQTLGHKNQVYDTTFVGKEKGIPISQQKHVLASCSCDFFCYTCEYALTHWGSSVIKYCNGEPAVVKNPQNHPLLCKHLVKVAQTVLSERM